MRALLHFNESSHLCFEYSRVSTVESVPGRIPPGGEQPSPFLFLPRIWMIIIFPTRGKAFYYFFAHVYSYGDSLYASRPRGL